MQPIRSTVRSIISAAVVVWALAGPAAAQNILATIPIPTASAGQIAVDPALQLIYTGGGPTAGSSLTVINGSTFAVVTTISASAGVSVDMKQDNFWAGTGSVGNVNVYGSNDTEITSIPVGSCPAAVAFDCHKRYMWVSSQCGTGNDPVWLFDADTMAMVGSAITPGGTITTPPVASNNDTLYVTSGGTSRMISNTGVVSATTFGTVMAIDSNTYKLFATSGDNLQVISAHDNAVTKTATLTYTPNFMGVNNAMAHVYLVDSSAGKIDVYTEAAKKLTTFTMPTNDQPNSIAVDSVRGLLFVDVFNTSTQAWSMLVIQDLSTVRLCGYAGSCDY
jgi:DNA-binding beta-propeller fold protein YncE